MIIIGIIGVIIYLYLSWRILKENYREEDIIAFSWVSLFLFLFGGRLTYGLWHWGIWADKAWSWFEFWKLGEINILGAYLLWLAFAILIAKDKTWKVWSFLEDSLGSIWWLLLLTTLLLKEWPVMIALVVGALLTFLVRKKYRSFVWYRNGKKGFLYLWFLTIFFLVLGPISRLYWLSAFSLIFGVGLFMLGDDKLSK